MKTGLKSTPKAAEMGVRLVQGADRRHLGHLLGDALRHFDARVLQLMAAHPELPLALANLAARHQISAAQIHLTRHLPPDGARASSLAISAGISKQAMSDVLDQCEAWGLIDRRVDSLDARAKWISYTPTGRLWLTAFMDAVRKAELEFRSEVGDEVATVVRLGLEAYAHGY
ncbi:MAG: MarR family winged helix-turn-helix transcriptional regulator [Cytophagales bacterium]|nr:MarR family winged helix-turn-helix transcriptional regulator [Cytophagales bacterium]